MKIAITGGAGFIGHILAHRLASQGHHIVVLDNLYRGVWNRFREPIANLRFITGDVRDRDLVREAFAGAEAVFHLAALSNVIHASKQPDYLRSTNVIGTEVVCEIAKEAQVRRLIFTSSREVYGQATQLPVPEAAPLLPKNAYGQSKVLGEEIIGRYQRAFDCIILRLTNVYGINDSNRVIPIFLERAIRGENLIIYGGEQVIDFVWVETVIDIMEKCLTLPPISEPLVLNIGSGVGTSILDLARRIVHIVNSESEIVLHPKRDIEVMSFIADVQKARELVGLPSITDPLSDLDKLVSAVKTHHR